MQNLLMVLLNLVLVSTIMGCPPSVKDPVPDGGKDDGSDDGGTIPDDDEDDDGGVITDGDEVNTAAPTSVTITSGGGEASSEQYRLRVNIGAPQPMGKAQSDDVRLKAGPKTTH